MKSETSSTLPRPRAKAELLDGFYAFSESIDSFLREVARVSADRERADPPVVLPGTEFAGRYRLERPLGRGAHGICWVAADSISGGDVAVKLIAAPSARHAARIRAEIGSLRSIRASGVVELLDEGVDHGSVFIVMPLVLGAPFPGKRFPLSWEDLHASACQLLGTLGQVHAAGIVHRDLKPANVLVDANEVPTVLDFGLSIPGFFGQEEDTRHIVGTPAYLSPEQIDGRSVDGRADLYAVGVMLYQSLCGRLPHDADDTRALLAAKFVRPPSLLGRVPGLPEHVALSIDAMLSPNPADRPASATEALRRLREPELCSASDREVWSRLLDPSASGEISERALAALFVEPETLSSLPEDAARLLHQRTGGNTHAVEAEIQKWLREGECRWEAGPGSRLVLDRSIVYRVELSTVLTDVCTDDVDATERAVEISKQIASEGELGLAIALLSEMLTTISENPQPTFHRTELVLGMWVRIALVDGSPSVLDRALYELCQNGTTSQCLVRLEALVRAALSVGAWTDRALDLASTIPPFDDADLELERRSIQVLAARRAPAEREERLLESLAEWRDERQDPVVDAHFASWLGRLRYRQGRYLEAAELHEQAATGPLWNTPRAFSIMHAASARMEAFQLEEARQLAAKANTFFRAHRHAKGCAQAGWFVRTIAYRGGDALSPDEFWIDQVARLGLREMEGLACLTEAAIAWRNGDLPRGRALADRGLRVWKTMGETAGAHLLTSGLALACAAPGTIAASTAESIAALAVENKTPGIAIQVLALVAGHRPTAPSSAELALAEQVPRANWHQRIDVLSIDEARELLLARGRVHSPFTPSDSGNSHPGR